MRQTRYRSGTTVQYRRTRNDSRRRVQFTAIRRLSGVYDLRNSMCRVLLWQNVLFKRIFFSFMQNVRGLFGKEGMRARVRGLRGTRPTEY